MLRDAGDPRLVAELTTTALVLADDQSRPGRVMLVARGHSAEPDHEAFMGDLSLVMRAVRAAVAPVRLNTIGSLDPSQDRHLVWHLVPRQADDPAPEAAVWQGEQAAPVAAEIYADQRRRLLRGILAAQPVTRMRA